MSERLKELNANKKRITADLKKIEAEFKTLVLDKNIPLDIRWKEFIESGFGETTWRTNFGLNRSDEFLYESPLYLEKYQVIKVDEILQTLLDDEEEEFNMTEEEVIIFKEFCLSHFYNKMKFDW